MPHYHMSLYFNRLGLAQEIVSAREEGMILLTQTVNSFNFVKKFYEI